MFVLNLLREKEETKQKNSKQHKPRQMLFHKRQAFILIILGFENNFGIRK